MTKASKSPSRVVLYGMVIFCEPPLCESSISDHLLSAPFIQNTYRINGTATLIWRDIDVVYKVHLDLDIILLHNKDGLCQISGLGLLRLWKVFDTCIDEEDIGEVVNLFLTQIGDLVNIAVDLRVYSRNVQHLGWDRLHIIVVDTSGLLHLVASRETSWEVENTRIDKPLDLGLNTADKTSNISLYIVDNVASLKIQNFRRFSSWNGDSAIDGRGRTGNGGRDGHNGRHEAQECCFEHHGY
ncbi:hypothetical protein HG530_012183 [Fusarium avenaceum]|nr:hypothetical protein HG530_012183 [Fusarium avenaceum]